MANYEIDPNTITGKDREEVIAAAKTYRPDYNMTEYQKRGSPPSGEIAARIGLSKAFIERTPQIRQRIEADELNSAGGRALAMVGQGGPGELRRAIDEGAEALLRGLTGAGMSATEATNYARRYQFSLIDTKETQLRKLNELEKRIALCLDRGSQRSRQRRFAQRLCFQIWRRGSSKSSAASRQERCRGQPARWSGKGCSETRSCKG